MIKKNSNASPSPSQTLQPVVLKSERTMKNEEECSFTLTDDDDGRDADGNPQRRSSIIKRPRQKSDSAILIQEQQQFGNNDIKEEENDDEFLKELENENKMLEEELRNLQNNKNIRALSTSQPRNNASKGSQQNANGNQLQRKIRFQDEQENSVNKSQRSQKSKTPKKDSPYQDKQPSQRNQSARSHSNTESPAVQKQQSSTKKQKPSRGFNYNTSPISNAVPQSINNTQRSFQSQSPAKILKSSSINNNNVLKDSTQQHHNFNPNQPLTIEFEKYKSLELRLMGCMRTIKTLEKENQARQDKIQSLQLELDKKSKNIDNLNSERLNLSQTQQRLQVQQNISSNAKRKEREYEAKIKECEQTIQDQRKQMQRFQELNKQLLEKVKETEQNMLEREGQTSHVNDELSKLRKEVQSLRNDKSALEQSLKSEKKKNEYLERDCQHQKEKYESLKTNSLAFERSTEALYQSHYHLTEKLKGFISGQGGGTSSTTSLNNLISRKTGGGNPLKNIQSKEENIKSIELMKEQLKAQEEQLNQIRENIKSQGDAISSAISPEKMRELEAAETKKEEERQKKKQEQETFLAELKKQKKEKEQELSSLEIDTQRKQQQLSIKQQALEKQEAQQRQDIEQRDAAFNKEMDEKEQIIQDLMKQLKLLKEQTKEERRKQEELEEQEDQYEKEQEELEAELDRYEEELDELDDGNDDDLELQQLMEEAKELEGFIEHVDLEIKDLNNEIKEQKGQNQALEKEVNVLKDEVNYLLADKKDISKLQKELEEAQEEEKNSKPLTRTTIYSRQQKLSQFDKNISLVNELKDVEVARENQDSSNSQLQDMINMLIDQNFLERKSRSLELGLRELEDKMRTKRLHHAELVRKVERMEELIKDQEVIKQFGIPEFKQKLAKFEQDFIDFEKQKDKIRTKKLEFQADVIGKDVKDLNQQAMKDCLVGYKEVEKELDAIYQKENDVLGIDKLKKNYQDIEVNAQVDYFKKCKALKEGLEKKSQKLSVSIEEILKQAQSIENNIIPNVTKIADDEDEKDILKSKIEILQEVKRYGDEIKILQINENLKNKLERIVLKRDDFSELCEHFQKLNNLEVTSGMTEKDINNLQKRLYDYESSLKQFEVELKEDFYNDSQTEVKSQIEKLTEQENLIQQLNEGIAQIEEIINNAKSTDLASEKGGEMEALQKQLDELRKQKAIVERNKKNSNRDINGIQKELDRVNLNAITPTELENFEQELNKQREQLDKQETDINDAINLMKQLQDDAQGVSFKRKADKRQKCKGKLKHLIEMTDQLERTLAEIDLQLEIIDKDADYLNDNDQMSPIKSSKRSLKRDNAGTSSAVSLKSAGAIKSDLEKSQVMQKEMKKIRDLRKTYENLSAEKDNLQKQIKNCNQKFDELPLETSTLANYEQLYDLLQADIDKKAQDAQERALKLLDNDLAKTKEELEQLIERFKLKRGVYADCRQLEAEKQRDVQKVENSCSSLKMRAAQAEKDLVSQQGLSFNSNQDKKKQINAFLGDIKSLKASIEAKEKEIENQRKKLHNCTKDLDLIGEKVVTFDNLKQIYKQISEIDKLKELNEDLKQINDELTTKEVQIDEFIKDLVGGSLYECERKLKDAEANIDKMARKIIEINNGMNDLDIDIKNGMNQNQNDKDFQSMGKKMKDLNDADRKTLQDLEDQKNAIKKVLQKIKGSLDEYSQTKSENKGAGPEALNAAQIEGFIKEIQTCAKKAENHNKELDDLEGNLKKRKDDWSKQLFKGGEKDALIDDIEKQYQQNLDISNNLDNKLNEIDKLINSLEDVYRAMDGNPDYELRQQQIKKQMEQLADLKKQKMQILKDKKKVDDQIDKAQKAREKGLKSLPLEQLKEITTAMEEGSESLNGLEKRTDNILSDLRKRRIKLNDADIGDNMKMRRDQIDQFGENLNKLIKDQGDFEQLVQELSKVNPQASTEAMGQIKQAKGAIDMLKDEKEKLKKKYGEINDKLKKKDLARDDPSTFIDLIKEIKDLGQLISENDSQMNKLQQQIKLLKNKFGGEDVAEKINQFNVDAENYKKKLAELMGDLEILQDLQQEFDGYTSDHEEEDFIERLGVEIKDLNVKIQTVSDENEQVQDKIQHARRVLERKQNEEVSQKEIEERAQMVGEIEEANGNVGKKTQDVFVKVERNKKVFMSMPVKEKLKRRQQEVNELNKRLEQFVQQVSEIEIDMRNELNNVKLGEEGGQERYKELEELIDESRAIQNSYADIGNQLLQVNQELEDSKSSDGHQFDLLKANIQIKKKILKALEQCKEVKQKYQSTKNQFMAKKHKKQAYKAAKGDHVDQLLADWINNHDCPVPIKRLGGGYYMFGSKKIFAKIINGNLLIRVGGGYMSIDEFMFYYGAQELNKMLAYQDEEGDNDINLEQAFEGGNEGSDGVMRTNRDGRGVVGIQQLKKRLSPRPDSHQQTSSRQMQQSPRSLHSNPSQSSMMQKRSSRAMASGTPRGNLGVPGKDQ